MSTRRQAATTAGAAMLACALARMPSLLGATPVEFVVGPLPPAPPGDQAYILRFSTEAGISEARKRVAVAENHQLAPWLGIGSAEYHPHVIIAPGPDGQNRNPFAPGQPLWNWHVAEFCCYITPNELETPRPTPLQLNQAVADGSFLRPMGWSLPGSSTLIAELNAELVLYLEYDWETRSALFLYWTHDDPTLDYEVEWTPSLGAAAWRRIDSQSGQAQLLTHKLLIALTSAFDGGCFRLVTRPKVIPSATAGSP